YIYTPSLHDALPILIADRPLRNKISHFAKLDASTRYDLRRVARIYNLQFRRAVSCVKLLLLAPCSWANIGKDWLQALNKLRSQRSEEHTSELQSRSE